MKATHAIVDSAPLGESPDFVRLSLAAAMTLGFVPGWFYRTLGSAA